MLFQSHIKFHSEVKSCRARYKQFSRFEELRGLLTRLQQDTKGNIMDIFLLLPSCGLCVNHFHSYFYSSLSFFFNFSGCNFKFSFSFSWVASLGNRVILPLVINNFNIIGYTVRWSQCLERISLKL